MNRKLPESSPIRVLQCLSRRGLVLVNFVHALRAADGVFESFQGDFLVIPSVMGRAEKKLTHGYRDSILVPKSLFEGIPTRLLVKFCREKEEDLAAMFCRELNLQRLYSWKVILESLEATAFSSGLPPFLLAILNFVIDVGQPEGVCRSKNECQSYRLLDKEFPVYSQFSPKIAGLLKSPSNQKVFFDAQKLPKKCDGVDELLCRIAIFFANDYIRKASDYRAAFREKFQLPSVTRKKAPITSISTDRKILQSLPDAVSLVSDGQLEGRMTSALRQAAIVVFASGLVTPHPDFLKFYKTPVVRLPREMPLFDPFEILKRYAVDGMPPTLAELQGQKVLLKDAAFRVMRSILVHGWQRHCSLIFLTLGDFLVGGEHPEVHITWTKTGLVHQSLPLWGIMPKEEIAGLQDFLHYCRVDLNLPLDTRLTKLAKLGEFEKATSNLGQKKFCEAMGKLVPEFLESTHLPRATGLSWAPIRALACYYPEVLNHPSLLHLKNHPWFRGAELENFRGMLASKSTDSVELFRRIACWSTTEQFVSTYCRSSHLLLQLYCYMQSLNLVKAGQLPG